jgi:Mrp family chromosome partitioning ATPase/capsular polysaccharide biosynthesis protein
MNQTNATPIFAPLWRRKWLILAVGIVVGVLSYVYYKHKPATYGATTQVYIGAGSEEQPVGEKAPAKTPSTTSTNDVAIINSIVVEEVRQLLRKQHKAAIAHSAKIKAKVPEKGQFITITAEAGGAKRAAFLANATAQTFIKRQASTRRRSIERAIAIDRRQLRRIEASANATVPSSSKGKSAVPRSNTAEILETANLNTKINQLELSLGFATDDQVKPAKASSATQLAPKPRQDAIFGFVIGIVLAAIAAYAVGRLDRRLRSLTAIEAVFQSQILAALPEVRSPIVRRDGQVTPSRVLLEPLRRLHTAIQLGLARPPEREGSARVILFISADAGDGKSTVCADLALVQRDAGERVAIVEANFRQPVQARLLGLDGEKGLAEVLSGRLPVGEAMQRVMPTHEAVDPEAEVSSAGVATAVDSPTAGSLFLLAGGGAVANPPALLANGSMPGLLQSVAHDFDYLLIDAPSPLEVSDVMPLLNAVDGIVLVARVTQTREMAAQRLAQLLAQTTHAPIVGLIANCVPAKEAQRYGFAATSDSWLRPGRLIGR